MTSSLFFGVTGIVIVILLIAAMVVLTVRMYKAPSVSELLAERHAVSELVQQHQVHQCRMLDLSLKETARNEPSLVEYRATFNVRDPVPVPRIHDGGKVKVP